MMCFLTWLPTELLYLIVDFLDYASEANAVSQTCWRLHHAANPKLYSYYAKRYSPFGLARVVEKGNADAVRKLLSADIDPARYRAAISDQTPIQLAAAHGHVEVLQAFVDVFGSSIVTEAASYPEDLPLVIAATAGHVNVIQFLLEMGVPADHPLDDRVARTALSYAAMTGSFASVKYLVEEAKCDVNSRDRFDQNPLLWAVLSGKLEVVRYLFEAGADATCAKTHPGHFSALYRAAMGNSEDIVRFLLDNNAYPNLQTELDAEALAVAVGSGSDNLRLVTLILSRVDMEAILASSDREQRALLLFCAAASGDEDLARRLLDLGCSPVREIRLSGSWYYTAADLAAWWGHPRLTALLLDEITKTCADYPVIVHFEQAVLHSIARRHPSVLNAVLDQGGNSLMESFGKEALLMSLRDETMSQIMVDRGALSTICSKEDAMEVFVQGLQSENNQVVSRVLEILEPSHFDSLDLPLVREMQSDVSKEYMRMAKLAGLGNLECFKMIYPMLKPSEDLSKFFEDCLSLAACHLHPDIVEFLLDRGLDVNGQYRGDYFGHLPLLNITIAKNDANPRKPNILPRKLQMIQLLLDRGADINGAGFDNFTALAYATEQRDDVVVKELLARGANPLARVQNGFSALQVAIQERNVKFVELFLENIKQRGYECDGFRRLIPILSQEEESIVEGIEPLSDEEGHTSSEEESERSGGYIVDIPLADPSSKAPSMVEYSWSGFLIIKAMRKHYWRMMDPA
ncbi:uncharacterized protein N7459_001324 [Penicillium hispanicum]|uniref:uncharacterized protein n=1 Tax=Penicillium hispanicum TaxID=1080232 RepID=UPI00254257B4|nr:uncharacterized protein N7459_001324 [Penicillium hispanicum]KAJ5595116.1 hypothetical protein N7459_001324 [Penicillium hispanicum]